MKSDLHLLSDKLLYNVTLTEDPLHLSVGGCTLRIHSNSTALLLKLKNYFSHVVTDQTHANIEIIAVESKALKLPYEFIDWQREPGKTGRKDAYVDQHNERLVLKVRTGMVFLQSESHRIAIGPCLQYDNQVINFINAQYMNWLQHRNWLICHAAGLVSKGKALAMAGFSGGGKSTLMLHFLEHDEFSYLTNDRLFIRAQNGVVQATGIPKLPRINPGTIVHNARLVTLLSQQRIKELLSMPEQQLWHLEEKYDVDIDSYYGKERIAEVAPLAGFLVLNWQRNNTTAVTINQVQLKQRQDLLAAIMKSPGPFYQYPDGRFFSNSEALGPQAYYEMLADIPIYEVSGEIDFSRLVSICREQIFRETSNRD